MKSIALISIASVICIAAEDSAKFGVNEVDASIAKYEKAEQAAMEAYKAAKAVAMQKLIVELKPMVDPLAKKDIQKAAALQTLIDGYKNEITGLAAPANNPNSIKKLIVGKWRFQTKTATGSYSALWTFKDDMTVSNDHDLTGTWVIQEKCVRIDWKAPGVWNELILPVGKDRSVAVVDWKTGNNGGIAIKQ